MIHAITQTEGAPASYPPVGSLVGNDLAAAWQRIEHHIAFRYTPRQVVWRLDCDAGEWSPPLGPIVEIEVQGGGQIFTPEIGPMGGYVLPAGQWTITATVGAGPVPAVVGEAVRRLWKYLAFEDSLSPGLTRFSSGAFNASIRREDIHPAKALQNSGAADLLRAYRRT